MKPFDCGDWVGLSPRDALQPRFNRIAGDGGIVLKITSTENANCFGYWQGSAESVDSGLTYRFGVEYRQERVHEESVAIYAVISWYDGGGELLERDYADEIQPLEGGWIRMEKTMEAPPAAAGLKADLALKWAPGGAVWWRNPSLRVAEPKRHRIVRVATTFLDSRRDLDENRKAMADIVDRAGVRGVDIVCLTETLFGRYVDIPIDKKSQPVPGQLTESLAEMAKRHRMYVIFSMHESSGDNIHNTAVLIGRNGEIVGR